MCAMKTVGIKTLKNKLSEYVRVAAAGETVQVTDRGKVVAELVPPRGVADTSDEPEMTDAERQMAELIRQGFATPAKVPRTPVLPPPPGIMTLEEMLRDLDESRSDR
jgi:prevent-host-death family protein